MVAKGLFVATLIAGLVAWWHAYTGSYVGKTSAMWGLTLFLGLMTFFAKAGEH